MLKTVKVTGFAYRQDGTPAAEAQGSARLSMPEIDNGIVVPMTYTFCVEEDGYFGFEAWPNERGTAGSYYSVKIYLKSDKVFDAMVVVPDVDHDVEIYDNMIQEPYPSITDAQKVLIGAQKAAADSATSATESQTSADASEISNQSSTAQATISTEAKNEVIVMRDEVISLEQASEDSAELSKNWAIKMSGLVDDDDYSSKYYANQSKEYSEASQTSSNEAEASAVTASNAATSANKSVNSVADLVSLVAQSASDVAESVSTVNGIASQLTEDVNQAIDGVSSQLDSKASRSANLSDLTDIAEARINLGLGSAATIASRNSDGLLSKEDKVKLDNLSLYPNTNFEKLNTALYVEYIAPITDVPYPWEVSENGFLWGDSSVLTGDTNKIFVRNKYTPTTIFPFMNHEEVVRILYWGDDIEHLSCVGRDHLEQVPLTLPKSLISTFGMFAYASNFNQDISSWDVRKIQNMSQMFYLASSFTQDLSSWDGSNAVHDHFATGSGIENSPEKHPMWETPIEYIYNDLGEIVTYVASPSAMPDTFYQKDGLWFYVAPEGDMEFIILFRNSEMYEPFRESSEEGALANITDSTGESHEIPLNQVVTSKVTSFNQIFDVLKIFNQDISTWDVSNVTSMHRAFAYTDNFNGNISAWDTSNVEDMFSMFSNALSFNGDISSWDTSNVTSMGAVFSNAPIFNQDISQWDVSKVTTMHSMFSGASEFNQPIGNWDVSNVEAMSGMFRRAGSFNQDISQWNVNKVTTMRYMFDRNDRFNQPLDSWDVSNVEIMDRMFDGASAFNQDLSQWCVSKIPAKPQNFDRDTPNWNKTNRLPVWGTCPE